MGFISSGPANSTGLGSFLVFIGGPCVLDMYGLAPSQKPNQRHFFFFTSRASVSGAEIFGIPLACGLEFYLLRPNFLFLTSSCVLLASLWNFRLLGRSLATIMLFTFYFLFFFSSFTPPAVTPGCLDEGANWISRVLIGYRLASGVGS